MKLSEVSTSTFESLILKAEQTVLVYYTGTWCPPCRVLKPTIEKVAGEVKSKCGVFSLDIDDSPEIAKKYGIKSIPAFILFENGEEKERMIGSHSYEEIMAFIG